MIGVRQGVAGAAAAVRTSWALPSILFFLVCSLRAAPAHAQDPAADAAESAQERQDEILVTARRQHGAVATDIPPETSLNSTAIRALGAADLQEVLTDLAPEIGNGETPPGELGTAPVVLVNGQRIAGFSSVRDFPPEAVRRIEIFPEKVALQYGYQPGQRVVNIVLRSDYRALTLLGRYTLAPDSWRGVYRAKVDLLRIGEDSHANLDIDFRHEDPVFAHDTLAGPTAAGGDDPVPPHTLGPQTDDLAVSGGLTRDIGKLSAELTGRLDLSAVQSRPGLSDEDGAVLAREGLSDLATAPLARTDRTVNAQTRLTLNGKLDSWRWSFIGGLDATTRETRTDAAGANGFAAILLPSPALLGSRCNAGTDADCVSTATRDATGDLYLNGNLFMLPAGAVTAALRTGFAFSDIRSASPLTPVRLDRTRDEGGAQANLDFPLTARDFAAGKFSVGLNGQVRTYSDVGTLSTLGSTLEWSPVEPVQLIATLSREQQAPTLPQLGAARLETPDLREYDFVDGDTAIVRRIEGGNGELDRQTSRTADVRLQFSPIRPANLTLSAEYRMERVRNPILSLTAATPATTAAFPDLFLRDEGYLTVLDTSPVNLARRDRQQLRWGINYSTAFGAAPAATKPAPRDQFQIALYHTWRFQDDVVLRDGLPRLDLLRGDVISDRGGTSAHQIELQTSLSTGAFSADINAQWQSPTKARAGPRTDDDRLTFSEGVTLNLRLQINLADQQWLTRRLPFLRGYLNLSGDNLLGAHTRVRDAGGAVPLAYEESYLNPTGRTFRITLRKRFR